MNLYLSGHNFKYELEKLIRIFMPFEEIKFFYSQDICENGILTLRKKDADKTVLSVKFIIEESNIEKYEFLENDCENYDKECERILAVLLFNCFTEITGYIPEWGILTGVRPAKLYSRLTDLIGGRETEEYFKDKLLVSDKKISLCKLSHKGEEKIISLSSPNSFSLYISIPFCPTRCHYCSFVSHSIDKAKKLIPDYIEKLCEEIKITGNIAKNLNLKLETVYIGGGTPTTLSVTGLEKIMKTVTQNFDIENLREYTVEAGRPDTITEEKLITIKKSGATRISINPQTMNNAVLEKIGRKHTCEQTIDAFNLAVKCGFSNINMDLIAGLPGDDIESFKTTVRSVCKLNPQSVTVHSLSMKRASTLTAKKNFPELEAGKVASEMVDFAREYLIKSELMPYYMYRQSKTVGNLENVGYSKPGYECLYNVYIMDETHTILACGASAVTKLREPNGNYIERIFNYKYPYEYISRFNELMLRKKGISDFYEKYS